MTLPETAREWHLIARPKGMPSRADFELAEAPVRAPQDGEVVVRNRFLSVDPYMRGRMNDAKSYVPPFPLGEPLRGGAVGRVVASRNERWPEGTWVQHDLGWREAAVLDGRGVRAVDPALAPISTSLGVLGMTGLTAFVGIVDIGEVALIQDATGDSPEVTMKEDGNAWHFMRRPTSIAFGTNGNLATCGEARTANYEDQPSNYNGPTLWSSDPAIFGVPPKPGQNGTHLDMLHETPFCMGIAHERDNVYWTFNGELGALDRYDFNEPHQIGGEDHADGELFRYVERVSGKSPSEIRDFFAVGMLMNVAAAMDLPQICGDDDTWAQELRSA